MLRLCSESLRLYPGRPHRHAMLCRCQKTSKALDDQALAHGGLLFIHENSVTVYLFLTLVFPTLSWWT